VKEMARSVLDAAAYAPVTILVDEPVTLKAGEALFIPAGTIRAAKNVGTGNAAELATYIVEKGKPLVVLVE
jgi:quercetin dioxygenase-like cupin family protein